MKNRGINSSRLTDYFSRINSYIEINNNNGLTDANKLSEPFFCDLLNEIYGYNLINLNLEQLNYPAVDLGDDKRKISFQITSDSSKPKIKKTIQRFESHKLSERFNILYVVVLKTKKTKIKENFKLVSGIQFDNDKNIIDLSDLCGKILSLPPDHQERILKFLELEMDPTNTRLKNLPQEVNTIIKVINYLSKNKQLQGGNWKEEPDPEGKIQNRFSQHSDFLKNEISSLIPLYLNAKEQVNDVIGLDTANSEFIKNFLRTKSNSILIDTNNNPKMALDNLTKFIEDGLGESETKYDQQAIRFYLIDELIKCNVFPN